MELFSGLRGWAADTIRVETVIANDERLTEGRREVISQMPFEERLPALAAHAAIRKAATFFTNQLYEPYEQNGFSRLGHGSESIVLDCHDGTVLKVHQTSYAKGRSVPDRKRFVREQTERQALLADKIGPVLVPATFMLGDEPRHRGRATVLARQRLVRPFAPLNIENHAGIAALPESHRGQIIDFAQGSFALHHERRMLPDIRGTHNIGFEDSQLRLIDTVPVGEREFGSNYMQNLFDLQRLNEAARLS